MSPKPENDFDFIIGTWKVNHLRLDERFSNCTTWTAFTGDTTTTKVLQGLGNVEDNLIHFPSGDVSTFYANDVMGGVPTKVRFTWLRNPGANPRWEQAFSQDEGQTWETNWTMDFVRV